MVVRIGTRDERHDRDKTKDKEGGGRAAERRSGFCLAALRSLFGFPNSLKV